VPQRGHANAGDQIQIFPAIHVVETRAAAANERDRLPLVRLDDVLRFERFDVVEG
jgi:hypothetical protein